MRVRGEPARQFDSPSRPSACRQIQPAKTAGRPTEEHSTGVAQRTPENVCEGARRAVAVQFESACPTNTAAEHFSPANILLADRRRTGVPLGNSLSDPRNVCEVRGEASRGSSNWPVPTITACRTLQPAQILLASTNTPTLGNLPRSGFLDVLRGCARRSAAVRIWPFSTNTVLLALQSVDTAVVAHRTLGSASADSREMSARCAAKPSRGSSNCGSIAVLLQDRPARPWWLTDAPPGPGIRLSGSPRRLRGRAAKPSRGSSNCPGRIQSCSIFQSANTPPADP